MDRFGAVPEDPLARAHVVGRLAFVNARIVRQRAIGLPEQERVLDDLEHQGLWVDDRAFGNGGPVTLFYVSPSLSR